ncbi:MAG: heme-binding domain-containing protein [Bacteroidia bacterium]|nr:heme-binding domain-containing protein [Bacteroidia bacterium]NND51324.1 heme-binding domain-containing protein [Flavobacteriaceae bacterium]
MKILKKIGLFLLVVIVIAQFFGPDKNDGEIASVTTFFEETAPPEQVKLVLKESCFDCHSSHTRYPWYNNITPVNYWLADHIKHGKGHFDASKWSEYSAKKKDHKLEELIEMVKKKEMPLPSYTWTHGEANLSDEQIQAVVDWAENARIKYQLEERPQ